MNYGERVINPYFIFRGVDSRKMGIVVTSMPERVRPERRVDTVEIPGRSGVLHVDGESYENYTKTVECAVIRRRNIDQVCAWLTGEGDVIFSTEPSKVYRVRVDNQISMGKMMQYFQSFQVNFDTYPFAYSVNAKDEAVVLTAAGSLYNRGTVYSEPKITVYGTGNVTLTVNGIAYGLTGIDGYVTMDSEAMEVYKDGESRNQTYMPPEAGELFPTFQVGKNTLSWTGNVEKVEVEPRWRWV